MRLKVYSDPLGNHWDIHPEMNLHMPQDPESEAELKHLAAVEYQMISPGNNASIIGIFQDSMLGSYQFTRENIKFTPREAMNLLMMSKKVNEDLFTKGDDFITNFDILSQILPPMSLKYKTKAFNEGTDDKKTSNAILEIKNGKYIRGQIDKSVLGGNSKGIIQRICNDFGNLASSNFIDDLQNIITEYLKSTAFSVGISDLLSNEKTNESITQIITTKKTDVQNIIDQTQLGMFENNTGKTNQAEFEMRINNILNQATSETGKVGLKSLNKDNRFVTMVNAGSKGSDLNISFMISCLGQQNVDGKRIPYGFEHRTLPHFNKFDDSPGARGFVENSYINGLSPQELFFHAMGGRVGLIDTAIKTASTGYISRRLVKGLEDLMVNYDMTIRTNKNKIVQFSYGDDGIDPTKVENQLLPIVEMSIQDIYAHYNIPDETKQTKLLKQIFLKNVVKRHLGQLNDFNSASKSYTEFMCHQRNEIIKNVFKYKGDAIVNCPVAFAYIINNIQGQCNITASSLVDITPFEAYQMIEDSYAILEKIHYAPPTMLFKILYYYYLSPKELLIIKRFNKHSLTVLLETIMMTYKRAIVSPGEMVGIIAGQSIGEISTQLTLNSVTFETEIIVRTADGCIKKVQIGDFIEKKIAIAKKIQYLKDSDTTYAELEDYYEIPSCDEDGNVMWKRIEAVTRHPVINKDGTNTMLKITTNEQREVIATKAKSFLKLVNGKIIPVNGDELKVGDYLPASKQQIEFNEQRYLNLREILPPTEYIYSSDVEKAKAVMHEYHWWSKHQGKTFTLPYKRSDSFVSKVGDKLRGTCKTKTGFTPNCVYPMQTAMNHYTIPEVIEMDYNFGYLIGAYAAEGCMTKFQLSIANNDAEYFKPILELCKKWNITTKIYRHENKIQEGWTSQDLRIYNTLLCRILEKFCGKLSHNKFVSDKIVFSNRECLLGFMDAYIGGDGSVNVRGGTVSMASVSKQLLIDVQQIVNILGIYSFIQKPKKQEKNNRGTLPENIRQMYTLAITGSQINKLTEMLNIKLEYKQKHLMDTLEHSYKYNIHKNDTIIPNEIDGEIVFEERNNNYPGVIFDKIKSIEEVPNTTNYAYDLTISDTKIFNTYNGLILFDTFHFSGVSSKSNVTTGVPRIEEILTLTSEPKNPSLNIYLKPEDETDKDKAHSITYMLEHTKLKELVRTIEICFDPNDYDTLIKEDRETIAQFKAFEQLAQDCGATSSDETEKSKWIIRMVMDAETMLEKNITMDDLNFTLNNCYENQLNCIYSDYNSEKLVFRIRMNEVIKSSVSKTKMGEKVKTKVKPLDQSDHIYMLKNFQDQLLENVVIRGISGIRKVNLRKVKDNVVEHNGSYKKQDIWVLDTIGTNLMEILSLDFIDKNRTVSNNIVEVYDVLGIEAARQTIYNEFVEVIEHDGTYINYHNFSILCDRMTFTSRLISICRHGINNDDIGPIAKASFEETPEMFLKAARHSELDTMRGVSANIMCGQEGFFGTSCFQVILDLKEMEKLTLTTMPPPSENEEEFIDKFFEDTNVNDPCDVGRLEIRNNVMNIKSKNMMGGGNEDADYQPGF